MRFLISSKTDRTIRFEWKGNRPELKFIPRIGHLRANESKPINLILKSPTNVKIEQEEVECAIVDILQESEEAEGIYEDWDDSMTEVKMVRPSEYKIILKKRDEEEKKRKEEFEIAQAMKGYEEMGVSHLMFHCSPYDEESLTRMAFATAAYRDME